VSQPHVLRTAHDATLQVSLTAENRHEPVVHLEAALGRADVLLEIADLDPAEAVELAGVLLRLARTAHIEDRESQNH
jgi:hypothetical protein